MQAEKAHTGTENQVMRTNHSSARSILVVEDDTVIRETMALVLQMEGYAVTGAANGQEALNYLRQTERPALILLDLMMPVMDGWEFRKEQQQDPTLADIPVVLVSAAGTVQEKAAALDAEGFLQKPIEVEQLLTTVQRYSAA
jgi:CheY-like chemotaxis protein